MTDQHHNAELDDWRQILDSIRARFRTGDFGVGLALVSRIGEAATVLDHHPSVTLNRDEVIVTITSPGARGLTAADAALAGRISTAAAELGATADVSGLTRLEIGLDTGDGERLAPFYAALLASQLDNGEPVDPSGQVPTIWWQGPQETDEYALPEQAVPQRWHFDVWVPHDEGERRLQAVLDAGGRLVSDAAAPAYWVVEDRDGNRSCICTPTGR